MISLSLTTSPSPTLSPFRHLSSQRLAFSTSISILKPFCRPHTTHFKKSSGKRGLCRAEFSHDAPFAAAIGACVVTSLLFPVTGSKEEEDGDSAIGLGDARFAVMGIMSFIPYFNWLSWVFAWLDTGRRRYVFYSLVYLAPYLWSNLSLSPDESWLPIASIIFCIIHIQLEASLRNGDIQGFQLFNEAARRGRKNTQFKGHRSDSEDEERVRRDLPDSDEESRDEIHRWTGPSELHQQMNGDWDDGGRENSKKRHH